MSAYAFEINNTFHYNSMAIKNPFNVKSTKKY